MALTIAIPIGLREPIGEFESLVSFIQETLDREDLTKVQISNIIALAEASINRRLRTNPVPQMETIATLSFADGATEAELPDDFVKLRLLRPASDTISAVQSSPYSGPAPISPAYYTMIGKKVRFARPVGEQSIEIVYYASLPGINENMPDNWLLNEYPDVYVYGALAAAEAFIGNDERVGLWKAAFDETMVELIDAGNSSRYGSGPLVPRGNLAQVRGARI